MLQFFFSTAKYLVCRQYCFSTASFLLVLILIASYFPFPAAALWTLHEKVSFNCPLSNKEAKITDNDKAAIRVVIQNQIEAFRSGDGEKAYSYASSGVKEQFSTAADFFNTLKSAYDS